MGITGLLPFLEKSKVSRPANLKEFKGCTVAADAYCWLHKGAFSCADKLARGEQTDMFVQYCMKYVNILLANDIKPILVFDGRHLPAKAQTEKKRRQRREENRKQAASLLRQGHTTEALTFLRRCIDVTHNMALTVMQECRKRNVDCIVAPYEADAQLAFFSIEGIADLVITEDSDLLLFGCKRVMFKLDLVGNGILVDSERLHLCMGMRQENYSFDKFRYMCILSGCDYLDSLPGIGLGKACKFITRTQDPDIHKALNRLPSQLNLRGLSVSIEYRDEFLRADAMFRHQLVYDPITRKAKPLTPHESVHPGSPLASGPLQGCMPEFDEEMSYQLALGNLDPFKLVKVDDYDPKSEKHGVKTQNWNQTAVAPHPSIWDPCFLDKLTKPKPQVVASFMPSDGRPLTNGRAVPVDTNKLLRSRKRALEKDCDYEDVKRPSLESTESRLTAMYSSPAASTTAPDFNNYSPDCDGFSTHPQEQATSPIFSHKRSSRNPFARSTNTDEGCDQASRDPQSDSTPSPQPTKQPSKFSALSKFARATHRTCTDGKPIVHSRYFANSNPCSPDDKKDLSAFRDVSNTFEDATDINMIQIYKSGEDQGKIPMVHKKPLFASTSSVPVQEYGDVENENELSVDSVLKPMDDKFLRQSFEPALRKSLSKNPFKRNTPIVSNATEHCSSVTTDVGLNNKYTLKQLYTDETETEDVDDPGFESSSSLTPNSLSDLRLSTVLSQPDDGFESPTKLNLHIRESPSNIVHGRPISSKHRKSTCRAPGLKKPSSSGQGQSKLSSFGFTPRPKIHHL